MYFLALAMDFDGTIAKDGLVDDSTLTSLAKLKRTGRRLILVTGRRMPSLLRVFPQLELFDRIVSENGAVVYDPGSKTEQVIAKPPPPEFVDALRQRNVSPLSIGSVIVATWEPNETTVLDVIRKLGLELQIVFNKGAVMVLPPGVNKASGLAVALRDLELSPLNVVGVGDAENDHAFLRSCGCAAAVANALPGVADEADVRLVGAHGKGVTELVERICHEDGQLLAPRRCGLRIGTDRAGAEVYLPPSDGSILIAGMSGVGKSTLATALTERMVEMGFQFCIFDPEGDYSELEHSVCVGDAKLPPSSDEILHLVRGPALNVVVSTQALTLDERPGYFAKLLPQILAIRVQTGRPHWLIVDEAHHMLSTERSDVAKALPETIPAAIYITVHPEAMAADSLRSVNTVLTMGAAAGQTLLNFFRTIALPPPALPPTVEADEILFWTRSGECPPFPVKVIRPRQARDRHKKKYAEGELDEDRSFYFRGPEGKLNLRAHNLHLFVQIAQGIDEETWEFHRRAGGYSTWFRDVIKDNELASEAEKAESDTSASPGREPAYHTRRCLAPVHRVVTGPAQHPP